MEKKTWSKHWVNLLQLQICLTYFVDALKYTGGHDTIPSKQQWKGLMCLTWHNSLPLLDLIQGYPSSFCQNNKLHRWLSDCSSQQHIDLNLGFKSSCKIVIIHDINSINSIISLLIQDNCADKYESNCHSGRDDDLSEIVYHLSFSFWDFVCWYISRWLFCCEVNFGILSS